ncbi:MAG: hypothetical protein B6U86_03505 [Candidatus Altiarchaeales archaeon ex4484_43]|nr:MAG: hypothetical protein B6U86_03505 [Candidatus Altiarchaeales archaeon ex4484_43]
MQPLGLTNPWALTGLLLVIPIILIYLLKPKPRHIKFPTIMFITRIEKDKRFRLFPRRFIRDPLLIIQLLIVFLLVLAIANPFFISQAEKRPMGNIVFVIDSSASMQSTDIYPNRFSRAKELAKKILEDADPKSSFSIILAENIPIVVLKNSDRETTRTVLDRLTCADTPTNIGDSILFARDMLSDVKTNREIYVFSDFSNSEGMDVELVSKLTSRDGIDTKLIKISGGGNNIGITDIDAKRFLTNRNRFYLTFTLENFNSEEITVEGEILVDGNSIESIREKIPGRSTRLIHTEEDISPESHLITVRIDNEDDLTIDNKAYAIIPEIKKYNVLLITDDDSDIYLEHALKSSPDIKLTKAISPVIPEFDGFDTIVQGEMNKELLLRGMYGDLRLYVEEGGNLVVLACSDLGDIGDPDLEVLLPVKLEWIKNLESKIEIVKDHEILKDTVLEDIIVKRYFKCSAKNESEVVAEVAGTPEIAYHKYGRGRVVYVGLNPNPSWSNFYYSSSMPIFWFQLIRWINRAETATTMYNFKTGESLPVKLTINITTPSNEILEGRNIILDETGIYKTEFPGNKEQIAVNLANEKESDIAGSIEVDTISAGSEIKREKIDVEQDLYPYLLSIVLLLLIIELIYYIRRGYFQRKT